MRKPAVFRWVAAAATLAAAIVPALAAPAQASPDQCKAGKTCYWSEPDFEGMFLELDGRVDSCSQAEARWPDGSASKIRALADRAGRQFELFTNGSCQGRPSWTVGPGGSDRNVADSVRSIRVAPFCPEDRTCFYENGDYTGAAWSAKPEFYNRCENAESSSGKYAWAVYNNRSTRATVFEGRHCGYNREDVEAYQFLSTPWESGAFKMVR